MSSKSYSTTNTSVVNMPKTLGVQDQGILAEGGSVVNVLDENAIAKSFDFADKTFARASDTTEKTLDLAGIMSSNESKNMSTALNFANLSFQKAGDMMNEALHYKASEQELSNEDRAKHLESYDKILSSSDSLKQNLMFYVPFAAIFFMIYKSMK